jgi:hypothetical protein
VIGNLLRISQFSAERGEERGTRNFSIIPMVFKTYIIHVYRFKKNNPRALVGVIEEVGAKGKKAFTNYDELWEILSSQTFLHSSLRRTREIRKNAFKTGGKKGGDNIL